MIIAAAMLIAAVPPASPDPFASDIAAFVARDRDAPPPQCATLFIGSSTIRMWPDLQRDFDFPVIQRGFGGSTIADVNRHFGEIAAPYKPRRIIFYAGDNDIDAGRSAGQAFSDFRHFLALKDAALGATPVYFLSVKPSVARQSQMAKQSELNRAVSALARKRLDLAYIDTTVSMLKDGQPDPALFVADGLHMNRNGYDRWRDRIKRALSAIRVSRAPSCPKG